MWTTGSFFESFFKSMYDERTEPKAKKKNDAKRGENARMYTDA